MSNIFIEERHTEILNIIEQNKRISIGDIQEKFGVSMDSARRDLRILEEKGLLKRTHGGAIPTRQVGVGKPAKMTARDISEIKENYFSISMKALSLIKKDDVIFLTSATVGYFMAQNIPDNLRIKVVTNSIVIAEELRKKDLITVILAGGEMDDKGNCYDFFAIQLINRMRFDKCFVTAGSISAAFGLSIQKSKGIEFVNAVIQNSKSTIGLFPTEKIGFETVFSICPASKLDILITDWDAPEDEIQKFIEQGIEIIIVDKEEK